MNRKEDQNIVVRSTLGQFMNKNLLMQTILNKIFVTKQINQANWTGAQLLLHRF